MLYINLDRGVVPGALIDEPQSSSAPDALEVAAASPTGAVLLLERDLSLPLLPVAEDQESAAAPQSSSVFRALGVTLPAEGAGAPQSSSFDFLVLGDDLPLDLEGTDVPQSSSFDLLALDGVLPLPRGAALAPVAQGLVLLVPLSSLAPVLDRDLLLPPLALGQSFDTCPSSLHCNYNC